jgi:hypothetical protein
MRSFAVIAPGAKRGNHVVWEDRPMQPTFYVWAKWDPEAEVWYTAETSIRGVNSSGDTLEELRERLMLLIPDFLEDQMPDRAVLRIIADREDELMPIAAE